MISIVVYGRNDSYGYNLHKRAALGLNCMAELLTDADDEILFVDYNTPDDFPTFPEAIADTLTARARERLRVFRVRPSLHARYAERTHLKALEPIARNIAVRRSNPANRWILSTNTDMIFAPRHGVSLSSFAAGAADGFYHLPRFELPESLWEGFNRSDPRTVITMVERYGREMFLNEVVYGHEWIKYDAPGDFQLMLRTDLFRIDGFDEAMLLGWHVDSNISKRLYLIYGEVGDASAALLGYHCDHTRQVTPAHEQKAPHNSLQRFWLDVESPYVPEQRDTWGCPNDVIEEVRLSRSVHAVYLAALSDRGAYAAASRGDSSDLVRSGPEYDARHVLPFLADAFASTPRHTTVAWFGGRADTLGAFSIVWPQLGFTTSILIDPWSLLFLGTPLPRNVRVVEPSQMTAADAYVFDFGAPAASRAGDIDLIADDDLESAVFDEYIRNRFATTAETEAEREDGAARRFVCINALNNAYDAMVHAYVRAASTPFGTRLRQGFVAPRQKRPASAPLLHMLQLDEPSTSTVEMLPLLHAGSGGEKTSHGIAAPFGRRGYVCRGPYLHLPIGDYSMVFTVRPSSAFTLAAMVRPVIVDVVLGADRVVESRAHFFLRGKIAVNFSVTAAASRHAAEVRLFRGRWADFVITSARLTRRAPAVRALLSPEARASRAATSPLQALASADLQSELI